MHFPLNGFIRLYRSRIGVKYVTVLAVALGIMLLGTFWAVLVNQTAGFQKLITASQNTLNDLQVTLEKRERNTSVANRTNIANLLAAAVPEAIASFNLTQLSTFANLAVERPDIDFAQFESADGKVLASAGKLNKASDSQRFPIQSDGMALGTLVIQSNSKLLDEQSAMVRDTVAKMRTELMDVSLGATADLRVMVGGVFLILTAIMATLSVFLYRRLVGNPLSIGIGCMNALASGRQCLNLEHIENRQDEIGQMAKTIFVFREGLAEREQLQSKQVAEMESQLERQKRLGSLVSEFEKNIIEVITDLDTAAGQMNHTATSLSGIVGNTRKQTSSAIAASNAASSNVQSVAGATEQLSSSISEITNQITRARDVISDAATTAEKANSDVTELESAAQRIGEVVNLIQNIAGQTNLLALNATIEAARAGEAGKGFAVVASEVKSLADQTANATGEIVQNIESIQGSTQNAVNSIGKITEVMGQITSITSSIAAAIEEQSAATNEIYRSIQEAASGTEKVAQNVNGMLSAVDETARSAGYVDNASQELGRRAKQLNERVSGFLASVTAA
jgi:methyl-accepting chemotaxis protein